MKCFICFDLFTLHFLDLMGESWGFDGQQLYPPLMSAWSKIQVGWVTPTLLERPDTYQLTASALLPQVYKITQGYPSGEYLLIENRQQIGYDILIPRPGLAIFHIDEQASHTVTDAPGSEGWPLFHYYVALVQADGHFHLEKGRNDGDFKDLFHRDHKDEIGPSFLTGNDFVNTDSYQKGHYVNTENHVYDISSNADVMTFCYMACSSPSAVPSMAPTLTLREIVTPINTKGYQKVKGIMFQIQARKPITLNNLLINTPHAPHQRLSLSIYVLHQFLAALRFRNLSEWNLHTSTETTGAGYGNFQALPRRFLSDLEISPSQIVSFFVYGVDCFLLANKAPTEKRLGGNYVHNRDVVLSYGRGTLGMFEKYLNGTFAMSGGLNYYMA